MTLYLSNRDGDGMTDEKGHYKFQTSVYTGSVLGASALQVTQNSPTGMSVLVGTGDFKVDTLDGTYSYTGWNTAITPVTISTADPANPRITSIVLYIDKGEVTAPSPPNNPGIPKFKAVNGTPGAVPAAPSSGTIQTAVGAANPYILLANVTVPAGASSIVNANIADQRSQVTVGTNLVATTSLQDSAITTAKLANLSVTDAKLASNSVITSKVLDGAVTDAKWRNGIAFNASRAAARNIAAATFTLFSCDAIDYNLGGGYSNASNAGRFTAPVDGAYMFYAILNAARVANTRAIIEIRKNGSSTSSRVIDLNPANTRNINGQTVWILNAGDYVEAFAWTQVATDISNNGSAPTIFGGFLITRT